MEIWTFKEIMVLIHMKSSVPPQGDFFAFYGAYAEVKGDEKWVKIKMKPIF